MERSAKIFVAGSNGLVGSALVRQLTSRGYTNLLLPEINELDLASQQDVADFFRLEKPEYVFLAAAKVGGIHANNTYPAEFIYLNLAIQNNVIHQSYLHGVKRLLFLGSSCIYPQLAPQPMKEEHLLTGLLEPTNTESFCSVNDSISHVPKSIMPRINDLSTSRFLKIGFIESVSG